MSTDPILPEGYNNPVVPCPECGSTNVTVTTNLNTGEIIGLTCLGHCGFSFGKSHRHMQTLKKYRVFSIIATEKEIAQD